MEPIASQYVVVLFGAVIVALSLWGLVVPARVLAMVGSVMSMARGMWIAVGARVVLGVALILAAPQSMFPTVFAALGWIALVAAVVLPLVGRARVAALLTWLERMPSPLVRLWLVVGVVFGAVLIYGA